VCKRSRRRRGRVGAGRDAPKTSAAGSSRPPHVGCVFGSGPSLPPPISPCHAHPGAGPNGRYPQSWRLVIFSRTVGRLDSIFGHRGARASRQTVTAEVAADDADGGRARSGEASWSGRRVVPCGTSPAEATGPAREAGEGEEGGGFHQRGGWRGWSGFQATAGWRVGAWRGETRQERVVFGLGARRRR